jgi:hypothetical protein
MTFLQRRVYLVTTCHIGGMFVFAFGSIWFGLHVFVWLTVHILWYCVLSIHVARIRRDGRRLMTLSEGRICRKCGYVYGEIDDRSCPECGEMRESDESKPLA